MAAFLFLVTCYMTLSCLPEISGWRRETLISGCALPNGSLMLNCTHEPDKQCYIAFVSNITDHPSLSDAFYIEHNRSIVDAKAEWIQVIFTPTKDEWNLSIARVLAKNVTGRHVSLKRLRDKKCGGSTNPPTNTTGEVMSTNSTYFAPAQNGSESGGGQWPFMNMPTLVGGIFLAVIMQ